MIPSMLRASLYLDYTFRVVQVVLILYVIIACPSDCDLTSNICKSLFLYRHTVVHPIVRTCFQMSHQVTKTAIREASLAAVWLCNRLWDVYTTVSRHPVYYEFTANSTSFTARGANLSSGYLSGDSWT